MFNAFQHFVSMLNLLSCQLWEKCEGLNYILSALWAVWAYIPIIITKKKNDP